MKYIYLILIISLLLVIYFINIEPIGGTEIVSLSNLQEKSVEIEIDQIKLVISFSSLLLGSIFLILFTEKAKMKFEKFGKFLIVLIILLSSFSIYCGFSSINNISDMLSAGYFNISANYVQFYKDAQFYSFLICIIIYGLIIVDQLSWINK